MKPTYQYGEHLPLANESGYARNILIESCRLDEAHYQVRAELTDNRGDFVDRTKEIPVHGMVVRLTIRLDDNVITNAEFATPRLAFPGLCDQLPVGAEALVGLHIGKGFNEKLREIYSGTKSCWHLYSLLQATVPAIMQCSAWNGSFEQMDRNLPPNMVRTAMDIMASRARNSCHAWEDDTGFIQQEFGRQEYGRMLNRMAPRLKQRWENHKEGGGEQS